MNMSFASFSCPLCGIRFLGFDDRPDWSRMANSGNFEEPGTAPEPNRWYEISLGPSFKDHLHHNCPKFCTLRYEFKPASIDKTQPGSLHKSKDNRVTVEFQNNIHGRPRVSFEGVCEDYKDHDAVLFFDGRSFRLERLHRAVKRLRHVRELGETAAAPAVSLPPDSCSPQPSKGLKPDSSSKEPVHQVPFQAGQIDVPETDDTEQRIGMSAEDQPASYANSLALLPELTNGDMQEEINVFDDGDLETIKKENTPVRTHRTGLDIDINLPHQIDTDDEIANVDASDDEAQNGCNAAEALRAQVNAQGKEDETSSSSSSSESDSSETGSGSETSSHDSRNCDGDSVISI